MAVPDKLPYTKQEKAAEIFSICFALAYIAFLVTLMIIDSEKRDGAVFLVVFCILTAAFSIGSVFPQHTNLVKNPDTVTEDTLRRIRRIIIFVKIGVAVLFTAYTLCDLIFSF